MKGRWAEGENCSGLWVVGDVLAGSGLFQGGWFGLGAVGVFHVSAEKLLDQLVLAR